MIFTMQEPFYGILLSSMNRVPEPRIETIGIDRSGNVFKLLYNPAFTESLSLDNILTLLKHECLHVAFNHFSLWDSDPDCESERVHRNIAEDMEINSYLDKAKVKEMHGVLPSDLGYGDRLGTREYYKLLEAFKKTPPTQMMAMSGPPSPNSGEEGECDPSDDSGRDMGESESTEENETDNEQDDGNVGMSVNATKNEDGDGGAAGGGGSSKNDSEEGDSPNPQPQPEFQKPEALNDSNLLDDHSHWPDSDEIDKEMLEQEIEDLLVFAAEEVQKACGAVPGEIKVRINQIKEKHPKPVTDWRKYMRRYLGWEFTEQLKRSKKRESQRFPDAPGTRHLRKSRVLVAVDTSASVSMPEYMEFFGQIKTLSQKANFTVLECDTRINKQYEFKNVIPTQLSGGGGTSFQPPVDYFNKHKKEYDALIYFTDGECNIPRDTPKNTLWVISSKGDQKDRRKYQVNGAKVVFIKEKK